MLKKLTIITVCYNSEATIDRCIDSIAVQLNECVEYIIIDGASNDNTLKIIQEKAKRYPIRYYSEVDSGIYNAMNKGTERAEGKWIWFVNSDDYIKQGIIVKVLEVIHLKQNDYDCIYGDIEYVKLYAGKEYIKRGIPIISKKILYYDTMFHPSFLCKREVFNEEHGFNELFKVVSDWDFIIRLYISQYRFFYYSQIFTVFYAGGMSSKPHILEKFKLRRRYIGLYLSVYFFMIDVVKLCILHLSGLCFRDRITQWRLRHYKERGLGNTDGS